MGKVRIKSFGDEEKEQQDQEKRKADREQKKVRQLADQNTSESIKNDQESSSEETPKTEKLREAKSASGGKKSAKGRKRFRSKSYLEKAALVDRKNRYGVSEGLDILKKMPASGWDETVELHVNTVRIGQFGNIMLPHGTGKQVKVAIADPSTSSGQVQFENLINDIEAGKIEFDILLASPDAMPKLARVARFLGPRGLMPNPKNGTISKNPAEAAKEFEKGQLNVKTEGKFPVIHLTVGKVSFGKEKLADNIKAVLDLIKAPNITSATLKSTGSPGVKIQIS